MIIRCASCGQENRIPASKIGLGPRCGKCKAAFGGSPLGVHSSEDFDELVRGSPLPVVVDFWADWCGPCRMVAPELERLAKDRQGKVVIAKVDTEELGEVAGRFGIRSIPTLLLFRGGKEAKRVSGAMPASQIAAALGV